MSGDLNTKPTQAEIDQQIQFCENAEAQQVTCYGGLAYENGVRDALRWVQGEAECLPIPDDVAAEHGLT